jgi:hypothetical protein
VIPKLVARRAARPLLLEQRSRILEAAAQNQIRLAKRNEPGRPFPSFWTDVPALKSTWIPAPSIDDQREANVNRVDENNINRINLKESNAMTEIMRERTPFEMTLSAAIDDPDITIPMNDNPISPKPKPKPLSSYLFDAFAVASPKPIIAPPRSSFDDIPPSNDNMAEWALPFEDPNANVSQSSSLTYATLSLPSQHEDEVAQGGEYIFAEQTTDKKEGEEEIEATRAVERVGSIEIGEGFLELQRDATEDLDDGDFIKTLCETIDMDEEGV